MTISFGTDTLDLKRIADSLERIADVLENGAHVNIDHAHICLLYTSPSPRD